jgi:protein-disulfide isomerase
LTDRCFGRGLRYPEESTMNRIARGASTLVTLGLLGAVLLPAQDWQTGDNLDGVDLSSLNATQKATVLKLLRSQGCSCGCSMKIAECRAKDPACGYSKGLAKTIVEAIGKGQNEADAIAAAGASRWAHAPGSRVLDDPVPIAVDGSPAMGPKDARITLVEFSDFQCPYCAEAAPQLTAILKAYPAELRLVFKQFPLDIHSQAAQAAAAALAAHNQGKFWALHDALFAHRRDLSRQGILSAASGLGLDMKRFEADMDSADTRKAVERDLAEGEGAGVQGTPTVFINGQRYNGRISRDALTTVLDGELKRH